MSSPAPRLGQARGTVPKKPPVAARRLLMALAVVAVVGLVLQFARKPLAGAGVLSPSRNYVAMGFTHPGALPVTPTAAQVVVFSFTIFNHGGGPATVPWAVRVVPTGAPSYQAVSGQADVGPGRSVVVPVRLVLHGQWAKATVEVSAPGQREAPLSFHLAEPRYPARSRGLVPSRHPAPLQRAPGQVEPRARASGG